MVNIDFFNMDADRLEFKDDYFDHSVCSFGLFFIPDMGQALQQWKRVVKPGGTLLFTSFTERAFSPMTDMFVNQLKSFGAQPNDPPLSSRRLVDEQVCRKLMVDAGLESITVDKYQVGYYLQDIEDWWSIVWNSGMRRLVQLIPENVRKQFKSEHLKNMKNLLSENGLWLDVEINISQGIVPEK